MVSSKKNDKKKKNFVHNQKSVVKGLMNLLMWEFSLRKLNTEFQYNIYSVWDSFDRDTQFMKNAKRIDRILILSHPLKGSKQVIDFLRSWLSYFAFA